MKCSQKKINLSFFEDFFESLSPADYAKMLVNTKNLNENKEIVVEIEDRILDLNNRIKKNEWNRKKNADKTSKIIEEILNHNKNAQKNFPLASKVDKGKTEPKVNKGKSESKVDKGKSEPKVDRRK